MRTWRFLLLLAGTVLVFVGTRAYAREVVRPHEPLNRAEAITAALRSREQFAPQVVWFTSHIPDIPLFADVDQSSWYAPFVEVGFLEGIITGFEDGTFHPADSLIVDHAVILLERIYERDIIVPYAPHALITRNQFFTLIDALQKDRGKGTYVFQERKPDVLEVITSVPVLPKMINTPSTNTFIPLPKNNTSLTEEEPFVLHLQVKKSLKHEYASDKPFAITIPSIGIEDVAIFHPADPFSAKGILSPLKEGLGHLFTYPGEEGKTMIYGHSSGYPWDLSEYTRIFRTVHQLETGARVYITYDKRLYVYEVQRKQIVDAKDVSPFDDDGTSELILYTCWPLDSIKERYLVHALPVEMIALR